MLARIRKAMQERDQGFTLIELLVVMIIIGILAAIAIPAFLNQRQKAVDSAAQSDLTSIAEQVAVHVMEFNAAPVLGEGTVTGGGEYYTLAKSASDPAPRNIGPKSDPDFGTPTISWTDADTWSVMLPYSGGTKDSATGSTLTYSSETGMGEPQPKS